MRKLRRATNEGEEKSPMEFSLPRGMRDILPEEFEAAENVRAAFLDTCRIFDYKVMEPSPLELIETLEAKSGSAVREEIYAFSDKSGRELGLRFDLTLGITRYVASRRDQSLPVRLGAYSSVWRYEEPQYGRYRWLYQWDAELYGPSNAEADAEIIEFTWRLFRKIGLSPRISMGSRKVIETFIRKELSLTDEKSILNMLRAIDKLSKKKVEEIAVEYSDSFSAKDFERVAELARISGDPSSAASQLQAHSLDPSGLLAIVDSLNARGVPDVQFDMRIARGLDYYTDMVFEAFDKENLKLGSLCGGGRYDSLPPVYGRPNYGATGVAGGVERAVLALASREKEVKEMRKNVRIFVAPIGEDVRVKRAAESIVAELRAADFSAQSEIMGRTLRRVLEAQSDAGTDIVIIVGEKELSSNSIKLKWMKSGREITLARSDLLDTLEKEKLTLE